MSQEEGNYDRGIADSLGRWVLFHPVTGEIFTNVKGHLGCTEPMENVYVRPPAATRHPEQSELADYKAKVEAEAPRDATHAVDKQTAEPPAPPPPPPPPPMPKQVETEPKRKRRAAAPKAPKSPLAPAAPTPHKAPAFPLQSSARPRFSSRAGPARVWDPFGPDAF